MFDDISQSNRHRGPIRILRPLRDLGIKECAAWAWWSDLTVLGKEKWLIGQSIRGLTKSKHHYIFLCRYIAQTNVDFIIGLEKDYPSTVSTIVRTCAKLESKDDHSGHCALCER
jgi:cytoplasmic tRNA 2-thiolation protein 2